MNNKTLKVFTALFIAALVSCVQHNKTTTPTEVEEVFETEETVEFEPHGYGGWYCPDNLTNFPAVDITKWQNVPVVNDRLPTEEEASNGTSLIHVDIEKHPNAKALDITMPKLAYFFNQSSQREELIIVIQAINVNNDSIVGFRYLNGGNGSARLSEVDFLSDSEMEMIPASRFVSHTIEIKASQDKIWEIITKPENAETLQPIFDKDKTLKAGWRETTNVNYHYPNAGEPTAEYGNLLFGSFYVQNDYRQLSFTEKFLLLEDKQTGITELKIVCGPFQDDFEEQKVILNNWGLKVKALSEKE